MASSSGLAAPWECTFQLGDKALPSSSYIRTWRSGEGDQVSNSIRHALLLSTDIEHYIGCRGNDLVLKLKWHTIVVSSISSQAFINIIKFTSVTSRFGIILTLFFNYSRYPIDPYSGELTEGCPGGGRQGKSPQVDS